MAKADFVFSIKANRYITHLKKLNEVNDSVHLMLDRARELKKKLEPLLFQLPPKWNVNIQRLRTFLTQLPTGIRYVFEFRNRTWINPQVIGLLKQNMAFCVYELEGYLAPRVITADFIYIRLHGPGKKYQGSYSAADLKNGNDG